MQLLVYIVVTEQLDLCSPLRNNISAQYVRVIDLLLGTWLVLQVCFIIILSSWLYGPSGPRPHHCRDFNITLS